MAGLLSTMVQKLLRQKESANKRERKKSKMEKMKLFGTEIPLVKEEAPKQAEDIELFAESKDAGASKQKEEKTDVPMVDSFLGKIDEFRAKAKQLQELLSTREEKVKELQTLVEEREGKAEELKKVLDERQEKADGITAEVSKKIDVLIERISAKLDEVQSGVREDVQANKQAQAEQFDRFSAAQNAQMKELLQDQNAKLKSAADSQSAQIQAFSDAQRKHLQEISDILSGLKNQIEENNQNVNINYEAINGSLSDISEKIHSENVKSYRNTVDLIKELEDKLDGMESLNRKVNSAKTVSICVFVISIINLLAAISLLALNLIF